MEAASDQTANASESRSKHAAETQRSQDDYAHDKSRSSKFRFKSSRSSKSRATHSSSSSHHKGRSHENDYDHADEKRQHRHRHRHHHRQKRRKTDHTPPASPSHNEQGRSLSPGTAFRESLFDAMGDDEGAAFWESVYGQPIHTYDIPSVPKGPDGELERMTDEEYTAYVRARMWERSHEGIMEERERQRREKAKSKQRAEAERRADKDRTRFDEALEESLQRGERRRRAKHWTSTWEKYMKSWEELGAMAKTATGASDGSQGQFYIRNHIHWPVESGKRRDISRDTVKEFMEHAPATPASTAAHENLMSMLKVERVRWHPDKMLHRYGSLGLSDEKALVQSITEVFQILDQLWIEGRERHSKG